MPALLFTAEITAADEAIAQLEAAIARQRDEKQRMAQAEAIIAEAAAKQEEASRARQNAIEIAARFGTSAANQTRRALWALIADIENPELAETDSQSFEPREIPIDAGDDDSDILEVAAAMLESAASDEFAATSIYIEAAKATLDEVEPVALAPLQEAEPAEVDEAEESATPLSSQADSFHSVEGDVCDEFEDVSGETNRVGISFGKTLPQLLAGQKTCTRRIWSDRHAAIFIRYWEAGVKVPALDKDRRYGGQVIGHLTLTAHPYKEQLTQMPDSDLAAEGGMSASVPEFIDKFFAGDAAKEVWVIRFEFDAGTGAEPQAECALNNAAVADTLESAASFDFAVGDRVRDTKHPECGVGNVDSFDQKFFDALKKRMWYVTFPNYLPEGEKKPRAIYTTVPEENLVLVDVEPREQHLPPVMFEMVMVSDRVGYLRDNRDNSIAAAYVGLDTDGQAAHWKWQIIDASFRSEGKVTARTAKRLPFNIELKIINVEMGMVDWLAQQDLTDIPSPEPEQISTPAEATQPEVEAFRVGDIVVPIGAAADGGTGKGVITAISKKGVAQVQWHSGFQGAVLLSEIKLLERKEERYFLRLLDSSKVIGPFAEEDQAIAHLREKQLGAGVICSLTELKEWHQVHILGLLPTGWYIFIDTYEPRQLFGAFESPEDAISYADQMNFSHFQIKGSGYLWSLKSVGVIEISYPEGWVCQLPTATAPRMQLPAVDLIEKKLLAGAEWLDLGIPLGSEALEHYQVELSGEALERFKALRTFFDDSDAQRALKIKWQLDCDASPQEFRWWQELGGASRHFAEGYMAEATVAKLERKLALLQIADQLHEPAENPKPQENLPLLQTSFAVPEVAATKFFRQHETGASANELTRAAVVTGDTEVPATAAAAQNIRQKIYVAWFHAGDNFKMPIKIVGPVEYAWQLDEIEQASTFNRSSYSVCRWTRQDYDEMRCGTEAEPYQQPKWVEVSDRLGYFQKGDSPAEAAKIYLGFTNLKTARTWAEELVKVGVIAAGWETTVPTQVYCKHELVVRPGSRHDALEIIKKLPLQDKPDREVIEFIVDNPLSPYYLKKLPPQDLEREEQRFAVYPVGYSEAKRHGEIWTPAMFPGKWESSRTYSALAPSPWESRDLAALATLNLVKPGPAPTPRLEAVNEIDIATEFGGYDPTATTTSVGSHRSKEKAAWPGNCQWNSSSTK